MKANVRARASVEQGRTSRVQTNEESRRMVRIVRGARKEEGPLRTEAKAPPNLVVVGVELKAPLAPPKA